MSFSKPGAETFQDKVCRHFDVPPEGYEALVLRLTPFIRAVGRLTRWRGFSGEAWDFQHDARNRHFTRRVLRLRVSVGRMRILFSEVWGVPPTGLETSGKLPEACPGSLLID
jgi:hypothetical protein